VQLIPDAETFSDVLIGQDAICLTVAHNAVMLAAPPLTGAGLRGDSAWIVENVQVGEQAICHPCDICNLQPF
jgi:hypothetical protein